MNKNITRRLVALAGVALAVAGLSACDPSDLDGVFDPVSSETSSTSSSDSGTSGTSEKVDQSEDYYTVVGKAQKTYKAENGVVGYCPADKLDRAVCAYGGLTTSLRDDAKSRGRQPINVDPAGWGDNGKVHIAALDGVDGSRDYNGWMWNRSHLLADSLGGDPINENLVTGTRTQNVGSAKNSGGMAYTETIARDYLDSGKGDTCPLYYAATPNYKGDELLPRTVTVDIQSCDKSIDQRVIVQNTANGYQVNYVNGTYSKD